MKGCKSERVPGSKISQKIIALEWDAHYSLLQFMAASKDLFNHRVIACCLPVNVSSPVRGWTQRGYTENVYQICSSMVYIDILTKKRMRDDSQHRLLKKSVGVWYVVTYYIVMPIEIGNDWYGDRGFCPCCLALDQSDIFRLVLSINQ